MKKCYPVFNGSVNSVLAQCILLYAQLVLCFVTSPDLTDSIKIPVIRHLALHGNFFHIPGWRPASPFSST